MQRFGRVVRLREGKIEEYERYHKSVWPEVLEAVRASGIQNYTIYRYRNWLFSYFELPDNKTLAEVNDEWVKRNACHKWESLMQELQEPLPESGADVFWVPMKEVFHL